MLDTTCTTFFSSYERAAGIQWITSDFHKPRNHPYPFKTSHFPISVNFSPITFRIYSLLPKPCVCVFVCVSRLVMPCSVTPWTVARQAPLSVEFSGQEYWSGLSFPSPWNCSEPGIEPRSSALQEMLYCLSHQGSPMPCDAILIFTSFQTEVMATASWLIF